ncbi:MAG: hypothetical protein IIW56_01420 [Oscillospiraceae bacterium]|jgi:hypothetical protein|nr:hypothetical protein [Oscillospiraceae bacterium]
MYNRYIPQPDGSYRRNAIPDQRQQPQRPAPPPPPPQPPPVPHHQPPRQEPISGFLRQLIPQGFDTGDLIIVLLLLLIAGDNQESRNQALLTLALYFIL